jgi:hypothetical protein
MDKYIVESNNGVYHIVDKKEFRYYITICGKYIHDETEPKGLISPKHKKCKLCFPMSSIIAAHS